MIILDNNKKNIIILTILIIITILLLYYKYFKKQIDNMEHFNKEDCIDTNVCLMLGIKKNDIINYFDNFINFNLITTTINKIGINSFNGFVYKIEYIKNDNTAYSVLKSTIDDAADNLIYEYIVGLFINKQVSIFPCFIETYGIFSYKNKESWLKIKDSNELDGITLNNSLNLISNTDLMNKGCDKYLAILLQYINEALSLKDSIKNTIFLNNELLNILFQIYLPLSTLSNVFTHDDLHCNNILLYKPDNNKYIKFHYHLISGVKIIFKSQYIAKIIDYGNSYFIDGNISTEKIYEKICLTSGCEDDCYKYSVNKEYKRKLIINYLLSEIILDIQNNNEIINKEKIELLKNIQNNDINIICENIINSFFYDNDTNNTNDSYFNKYEKIGDLYVFQDGRKMEYIEK